MKKILSIIAIFFTLVFFACKKVSEGTPTEPIKNISGSWMIIKALRNGTDLTSRFDFSGFRINFSDTGYIITNPVPFIVSKNGRWHFDDPQYPFKMFFTAQSDTVKSSAILYPIVSGLRNIVISFSPGCTSNIYQYTLQKAN